MNKTLIGKRFAMLTVICKDEIRSTKHANRYQCLCDCGNITSVVTAKLNNGSTKSCGCYRKLNNKSHGMRNSKIYSVWRNMINRCDNSKVKSFEHYGARGIGYSVEWSDFEKFHDDMGDVPDGLTLERIDVNCDYNKLNCKWDKRSVQSHNRRKLPERNHNTYSNKIGVSWNLARQMWSYKVVKDRKVMYRGLVDSEDIAALMYDNFSEIVYGDRPNGTNKETII